jgi:NAD(P)-dependent dehydrogenase (short-subunit alcohol dehydrogenase family)
MSRTVVVGASSGLGRCIGIGLAQRGDQVALLARRRERIESAAKEAGPNAIAVECDITDEASLRSAIDQTADALGGIDNIVYTPAISPLVRMVDTDAEIWRRIFDTNVIGASLVTAAAMPPDRIDGKGGLPVLRRGSLRSVVAGPRRVRRQ